MRTYSSGFTLLEIVVTIAIIGTLSLILMQGYSTTRVRQALVLAQADIESMLKDAQKQAMNEERDETCLSLFAADAAQARACSDVGVHFQNQTALLFADTNSDGVYSASDYHLREQTLPAGVSIQGDSSFIFQAVPPTVTLVVEGAPAATGRLQLQAGNQSAALLVNAYGQVEKE